MARSENKMVWRVWNQHALEAGEVQVDESVCRKIQRGAGALDAFAWTHIAAFGILLDPGPELGWLDGVKM